MNTNCKKLLILVCLTSTLLSVNAGCPSKCTCSDAVVNCTAVSLEAVPNLESLDVEPTSIDFSGNEIINIQSTDFSFDGSSKVQYLYLSDNSILDIHESAFLEMSELKEIYLARNLLESVPPMLIEENKNLVLLDLSGNFFDMNNLELHSDSLEVLDLSSTKISSFTEDNIKYLPNLKVLNLRFNNLKYIEPSVFNNPNLLSVDVYYNVWECNQNTIDLFNLLVSRNLTEIKDPIKCVTNDDKYKDIYTRNGPVLDSLNLEDTNKIEEELKELPDYYDLRDDAEINWDPYLDDTDTKQLVESLEPLNFDPQEEDVQNKLDEVEDNQEEEDEQEEDKEDEEEEDTVPQQEEDRYEYPEEETDQQQEQENYDKQQTDEIQQQGTEEQQSEEAILEANNKVLEQEKDEENQDELQRQNESEQEANPEQQEREDRRKQEEEEVERKVLEILQARQDYQEVSENDKTDEEDASSIDIAIIREQHYFVVYQPDTAESDQTDYQFYFTNNLAVLIGVTAFVLTFLLGTFVGLCTISNKFAKRSWRRRDMSASTSTLISKLSQDIA